MTAIGDTRKRGRWMWVAALCALTSFVVLGNVTARAQIDENFCGSASPIVGFGSPSQFSAHYELFIHAYESRCKRASGFVDYFAGDDPATITRMLYRQAPDSGDSTLDAFWALDRSLGADEKQQIENDTGQRVGRYSQIGQFPLYVKGLAVAYNLSCQSAPLNMSGMNLSLMYLGVITKWNDPRLVQDNPGLANCSRTVKLTGRADNSGLTTTFKTYMSKWNPIWTVYAQSQLNTQWPGTLVCHAGSDRASAGCVASQPGSIGYVDSTIAKRQGLQVANVQRLHIARGDVSSAKLDFAAPSLSACTTAASSIQFPPLFDVYSDWSTVSLVNANDGYPICYFSFVFALHRQVSGYARQRALEEATTLRDYLSGMFTPTMQKALAARGYGLIPANILAMDQDGVARIEFPDCPIPVDVQAIPARKC
ncbi:MAG: hypothetical protein NVSMB57_00240 [Actinomycetota bacterium]